MSTITLKVAEFLRVFWGSSPRSKTPAAKFINKAIVGVLLLSFVGCAIATYSALGHGTPLSGNPETVIWLLNADLIILVLLGVILARRVVALWSGRKRGLTGSHLHVRLVYSFSLLAAVPAIVMTVFSALFFHYGVQAWLNERVQGAINNSYAVAEAYLQEHKQSIAADVRLMAQDILRWDEQFVSQQNEAFEEFLRRQSFVHDLPEAIVFDTDGRIYGRSGLTFSLEFETIPTYVLRSAAEGETVVLTTAKDDRVRALVEVNKDSNKFLYVGRMIDPAVLGYLNAAEAASNDYSNLRARYADLQITVILIFVAVAMMLLLLAIWLGLVLARQLVQPISRLVDATDQLRSGDFSARLPEDGSLEEFDHLAQAFNKMTAQIQAQRGELLNVNRQLDARRRLIETVLRGVTTGVVGLGKDGRIHLANMAAQKLLRQDDSQDIVGLPLEELLGESLSLFEQAKQRPQKVHQDEIEVFNAENGRRIYVLRIVIEQLDDEDIGAIITLDDITDIQKAQKKAAWSDVARRIAHEIKNPLTPIQLSAERLKRRYASQITDKPEVFLQCTDTIIRHVGDIGHMVSEFSAFARMPEPQMQATQKLETLIEESIFLQKQAFPNIDFVFDDKAPRRPMRLSLDPQQIRQVFTNLLQNAAESILEKNDKGTIHIISHYDKESGLHIIINDSGPGFPEEYHPSQLLEPYITLKDSGTGLGLAIVKKIMDDHDASITLGTPEWIDTVTSWKPLGGAVIVISFPGGA
ncbi:MAG: two-component sensor histidine kinase [Alphaproteobacteria bacterium]|nr:two-component sensor histidine kinase [Alphaproteobacteria bacterium]HCQ71249.1 two-component sensor histidine kinase [Rhodospirillaceae bacterium]|tara:strand:- start:4998 stop:7253 length:2256 start_codon:yes stop_codon:yes gene_type:complete